MSAAQRLAEALSSTPKTKAAPYVRGLTPAETAQAALAADPALADALELGLAWAEAEAALGQGRIASLEWPTDKDDEWMAAGYRPNGSGTQGFGPTPAEALRNLAAKLRESQP